MPSAVTAASVDRVGGKWLITGLADGSMVVWDSAVDTASHTLESHGAAVTAIAQHGDRWLVSGDADGDVHMYANTHDLLPVLLLGWSNTFPVHFAHAHAHAILVQLRSVTHIDRTVAAAQRDSGTG